MYEKSSRYYDQLYRHKDYGQEARKIQEVIRVAHPTAVSLLDVGCGTGEHAKYLSEHFEITGIDLNTTFIETARAKVPCATFEVARMPHFLLKRRFDVVACLFASIAYLQTIDEVKEALECFRKHLEEDGIVLVDPWLSPALVGDSYFNGNFVDEPDIKIHRVTTSRLEGHLCHLRVDHLIATREGNIDYFTEHHVLGIYSVESMLHAFQAAGLQATYDEEGIFGRGLYIAKMCPEIFHSIPLHSVRSDPEAALG